MLNIVDKYKIYAFDRFHLVSACMWMPKPEANAQVKTLHFNDGKSDGNGGHCGWIKIYVIKIFSKSDASSNARATAKISVSWKKWWA
jgi:hypothetical protein